MSRPAASPPKAVCGRAMSSFGAPIEQMDTLDDLMQIYRELPGGQKAGLDVFRNQQHIRVSVPPGRAHEQACIPWTSGASMR